MAKVDIILSILIITAMITACGKEEMQENNSQTIQKNTELKETQPVDTSKTVVEQIEKKPFNISDFGEVMGKEGTAIFFYTKYRERGILQEVADYYKKRAIKNRDKNVFVNFFDAKPAGVNWKYPMSNVLMKHWLAEYVYSKNTNRDELRFIEH